MQQVQNPCVLAEGETVERCACFCPRGRGNGSSVWKGVQHTQKTGHVRRCRPNVHIFWDHADGLPMDSHTGRHSGCCHKNHRTNVQLCCGQQARIKSPKFSLETVSLLKVLSVFVLFFLPGTKTGWITWVSIEMMKGSWTPSVPSLPSPWGQRVTLSSDTEMLGGKCLGDGWSL